MKRPLKLKAFLEQHGLKIKVLTTGGGLTYGYIRRIVAGEYPVTETFKAQVRRSLPFLTIPDELFEEDENGAGSN